jgi:methionyl-tRNA formyltransferase
MEYIYVSSGSFGTQVLQHLDPKPALVITGIDKLGGRGMKELIQTPVKRLCIELHIPYKEVTNKSELVLAISNLPNTNYQLLLADFGVIIPSEILHLNDYGIWNIHPSLLPKYRGTTPIQTALLNGEKVTGVTIMQMDEQIDHGPIVAQKKLDIDINDTNITLQAKLAEIGAKLFCSLQLAARSQENTNYQLPTPNYIVQDHSQATFTKKLTKEDGFVPLTELAPYLEPLLRKHNLMHLLKDHGVIAKPDDSWLKQPNTQELLPGSLATLGTSLTLSLHNRIRAFTPWPTVWTKLIDESVLKITGSTFEEKLQKIVITEIERNGKKYSDNQRNPVSLKK